MKKILSLILALTLGLGLCSCESSDTGDEKNKTKYSSEIWDCFDTVITIMAYCENEEDFAAIKNTAEEYFKYYNKLFDIYNDYEGMVNVKTINDNAGLGPVKVDGDIIDLLTFSRDLYDQTRGNVNVAFGSVLRLWHEAREISENNPEKAFIPDAALLKEAALHCDIDNMAVDETAGTVSLLDPVMSLDVGAVAKGFATELTAEKLEDICDNFLITAGSSSIRCFGTKPDGSSWITAVETDPDYSYIGLKDNSITTSGSYQRYYELDGVRYHHIINKDSLMPENNFLSVTVICENCGLGDGMATALFNMSLEEGQAFVQGRDDIAVMWIKPDNTKICSDKFKEYILK